jgi:hypothetical protein
MTRQPKRHVAPVAACRALPVRKTIVARTATITVVATVLAIALAACGGSSTPPPSSANAGASAATIQDRHLTGNVDPNRIFQILAGAGLPVHQESLGAGPSGEPVSVLFVRDGFHPLAIQQFSSPKAVTQAGFKPGTKIAKGDSTYTFWAANIVINLGPSDAKSVPATPTVELRTEAARVVAVLDPFIGPFYQRSVDPILLPTTPVPPTPEPTASPKSPAPSPSKH